MDDQDLEYVRLNVRNASLEDLLDRATVYRERMEPSALEIIDAELIERGVGGEAIKAHLDSRRGCLIDPTRTVIKCSFCDRPAVERKEAGWGWQLFLEMFGLTSRPVARCSVHAKSGSENPIR